MTTGKIAATVVALGLLAGCSVSAGSAGTPTTAAPKDAGTYAKTTCREWLHGMTQDQQTAAAEQFAVILNARDQSRKFARGFARNISTDCRADPSIRLSQIVAALATLDTADFPR